MKKILAVIGRDVKSGTRDWLIIYLSLASIMIALILRSLIPSVSDSTLSVVVTEDTSPAFVEYLETKANVTQVKDLDALKERILRIDDILGVVENNGTYEIISQGN